MKSVVWLFKWLLKAAIFFTLFAFALNNQGDATVRFFFGHQWTAPLVLIVLSAFGLGMAVGVLGMVPRWWRHRRMATQALANAAMASANPTETPSTQLPHGL